MDELHDKRRAFLIALGGMEYGRAVTIGSYVGALITKNQVLENERQQLEKRVQELEGKLWNSKEDVRVLQLRVSTERKTNKRHKQALEFYADKDNYNKQFIPPSVEKHGYVVGEPVLEDGGEKARLALQGGNENVETNRS